MDDRQKDMQKNPTEAREIVMSTITAALAARVDGDNDLYVQLLVDLGERPMRLVRGVVMTQASTIVSALIVMAQAADMDPRECWQSVALAWTSGVEGLPKAKRPNRPLSPYHFGPNEERGAF